jgi:type I restriction enzyme R subunit
VLDAIAAGRDRILLTLATGTGKTFIAFQLAWKLFQSRWNLADWRQRRRARPPAAHPVPGRPQHPGRPGLQRVLGLPDDALVRIAPGRHPQEGRVPKNGSIFFTIFQTFMSGRPAASRAVLRRVPADFFDFIVIDECHRGGANDEGTWRAILDYFAPAVQLGLTATPKRTINADTYAYFGEPVYVYSLKEGINDGFLTPFKVKQIATTLDEYVYTPDDQVVEGDHRGRQALRREGLQQDHRDQGARGYRVKLFMGMIDQREKTIVFCATQAMRWMVRDLINQIEDQHRPDYCVRVTANDGAIGDQHLRDFQDNEKTIPTILTTSQKLSTGVDARNVRNIVLMRPVNSMIEFKQIIGRGTRLYDGKDYFTIYDFVKAHHHFSDPEWDGEPLDPRTGPGPPRHGGPGITATRPDRRRCLTAATRSASRSSWPTARNARSST